jgi:hypothetical protein
MAIKSKKSVLSDVFGLRENPFRASHIYNVDKPDVFVPEMYGEQLREFHRKFFLLPLGKETKKQVIGALWSSHQGDDLGKGFGKSMLMAEESRRINTDFGRAMLELAEIGEQDIEENPVLSGYCTFDESKVVKSFPAALLDAVIFILESKYGEDSTVHAELRRRLIAKLDAPEGYASEEIKKGLLNDLRKYRGLNIQLTHATLNGFIDRLCHEDTGDLVQFVRQEGIGPRIKATQGFNFVHVFNAFASLAGIVYVAYFIDQIENFALFTRRQDREVKVLRESMCQTSPTAEMSSFIFQMHIRAEEAIENIWINEDLPSLSFSKRINGARIVYLEGLGTTDEAVELATHYLDQCRMPDVKIPNPLHPFTEEVIEAVRLAVKGNPRSFLESLFNILNQAESQNEKKIDLTFVRFLLEDGGEDVSEDDEDNDYSNPERE